MSDDDRDDLDRAIDESIERCRQIQQRMANAPTILGDAMRVGQEEHDMWLIETGQVHVH